MNALAKVFLNNQLSIQTYNAILVGISLVIGNVWQDFFTDLIRTVPFFASAGWIAKILFPFILTVLLISFAIGLRKTYERSLDNET
jgi:hypothetical protein